MRAITIGTLALTSALAQGQDILLFENFENVMTEYVATPSDDLLELSVRDYYGRINTATTPLPAGLELFALRGSGYYGAEDTERATVPATTITLDFDTINIAGRDNITISLYLAEDDTESGSESWDGTSSFRVEVSVDGGVYTTVFAVEAEPGIVGDQFDEAPLVDTNLDGIGDGAEITEEFMRFDIPLAMNGASLDMRFIIENLDAPNEDIAIDDVMVVADPVVQCSPIDLAPPFGVLNFSDIIEALTIFSQGCP